VSAANKPTRYFIALALPERASTALSRITGRLDGARWSRPDMFHVTLAYLGGVEAGRALAAFARLRERDLPLTRLDLAGLGVFDNPEEGVVYNPVGLNPNLAQIQRDAARVLREQGFPPPRFGGYTPHVTQATVSDLELNREPLADMFARHGGFRLDDVAPAEMRLYASRKETGRTVHLVIDSIPCK
jgi:2'-5' RNA ligase